ncbi:phage tail tape measure protein [Streptomyces sp. NPDC014748]|uniref:phage tail tape measure protein n=1 Tax=Streptomyces sp. NPDC014748 TaxID=3364905 RepID=UPI0036FB2A95
MSSMTTRVLYDLVARDRASKTFSTVGANASRLEKTSVAVGAAIRKGLAVGTAAVAGIGVVAGKAATDFEAEMTRIASQAGGTTKDVKVLSSQVLALGGKVQQGPQTLADALFHLKAVGMDNASAMKALREASDLAAVGHADLEQSANALAGAWRTGIKGATSFREAVSTVNAIIGAGNMSLEQFNAAIGTGILPSAKTFGLSLKQVGAALALMTDEGIDSASAATRLRMSFSLLGAPSGAAEKQLKKIHLTGLQLANAMRGKDGLIGALTLLKDHLDASGMSAAQQSQLLSRAFGGGRSSSGILLMLNNLDVLIKKQEQINKSTDRYAEAVKLQRQTAQAEWARLTTGLESMSVRLGLVILPPVTGFVGYINDKAIPAAGKFGRALASLVPVAQIKKSVADVKSTLGGFLSEATSGIGGFLKGLTGEKTPKPKAPKSPLDKFPTSQLHPLAGAPHLGAAQTASTKGAGAALTAQPHYGVGQVAPVTGVQGAPLRTLNRPHGGAGQVAPLVQQPTKSSASAASMAMPHGGSGLAAPLVKRPEAPKAKPKTPAEQLGETVRKAVSGGIENVDWAKLGPKLGAGLATAIGWVGQHTADLTKRFGVVLSNIDFVDMGKAFGAQAIPFAIGFIENLFGPLFSLDFWEKHWLDVIVAVLSVIPVGRVAGVLGKVFEHIPILKVVEPLLTGVSKLGGWIEKGLGKAFGPLKRGVVDGIRKAFPEAAAAVEREAGLVTTRLGVWGLKLLDVGSKAARGLGSGIEKGVSWVTEKALGLGKAAVAPFAKAGGWLLSKGRDVVAGLSRGIGERAAGFGTWVWNRTGKPVGNAFANAGTWLLSKGRSIVSGAKSGVVDGAKGLGSWFYNKVARPPIDAFANAGSWLWSKGRSIVSGAKSGVVDGAKGLGAWFYAKVAKPPINAFANARSWLRSKGAALISGMKDGVVDGVKGIGKWVKSHIVDPVVNSVKHFFGIHSPSKVFADIGGHLVSGLMKGMATTSGTAIARTVFGDLPSALGAIVGKGLVSVSKLPSKAMHALAGLGDKLGSLFGDLFGGGGGGSGVSRWSGTVATALGLLGAPASALPAVLKRIQMESGGNPTAINLWDSNATAGDPSRGLMQTIGSTFAAYAGPFKSRGIYDPLANVYAGINYAMHAYGSNWINVMTRPGGYAKGTRGARRGLAWVGERGAELVNFSGGEDVLSHEDSVAFARTHGIKLPGYASGTILNAADRVTRDKRAVEDAKDALSRARRRRKGEAAAQKKLQAAEKELKAAEVALANAKRSAKVSIQNTINTGLLKTLETGTSSAIASAVKSLATKLLNAGYDKTAGSIQKKGAQLQTLADKKASLQSTIDKANAYATDQAGKITDFLDISGTSATSVAGLISQMTTQQRTATDFVSLSARLKQRGASTALLQELADAGPGSQLAAILGAKNVQTTDIAKLNSLLKNAGALATNFGRDMADIMYDSGADASKGFLAGLKSQQKALQKQMDTLAQALVTQVKKSLKIKSPSVLMRDQVGKQVALGVAVGMDRYRPHVAAAGRRLATTAYAASAGGSSARANAAFTQLAQVLNSGQATGTEVHVHFDDPTLRDLIRVTTKPMIKASEDRQAYRATVGRRP